jgi:hypothetical protein
MKNDRQVRRSFKKMSAPLERQSHWFKVALPSKTAVPLVFDLA